MILQLVFLKCLLDEDNLVAKIKDKMPQLARDLEDLR